MAQKVVWSKEAEDDLINILIYWNERNKSNAYSLKLFNEFMKIDSMIALFPNAGKETDFKNVRAFIKDNFSVYYSEQSEHINILHVWDNRRNPEDFKL